MIRGLILLLLSAMSAEALTINPIGTYANNTSSSSMVVKPTTASIAAGSTGVLMIAADNAAATGVTNFDQGPITDSVGNIWYLVRDTPIVGGALSNVEMVHYYSILTTALTNNGTDNITVTFKTSAGAAGINVTSKTAILWELVPSAGRVVLPPHIAESQTKAAGSTAAPSASTNQNVSNGRIFLPFIGTENPDVFTAGGDTSSTNGTFSSPQHTGIGSGATGMSIQSQYKIITAGGAVASYAPTLSSTISHNQLMVCTYSEVDSKACALGASNSNEANTVVTVRKTLPAGSLGVLTFSGDNQGASGGTVANYPTSINDTQGNSWTRQQDGIQGTGSTGSGTEIAIYTATITTAMAGNDTITITYITNNVTNKCFCLWNFVPSGSGSVTYASAGAATAVGSTATPSLTTTSITSGDYVVGIVGSEATDLLVGDSDTSNGSWSLDSHTGYGTGSTGMALTSQYKLTTGTATQTYNASLSDSIARNSAVGWVSLHDSSPVGNPGAFLQLFP